MRQRGLELRDGCGMAGFEPQPLAVWAAGSSAANSGRAKRFPADGRASGGGLALFSRKGRNCCGGDIQPRRGLGGQWGLDGGGCSKAGRFSDDRLGLAGPAFADPAGQKGLGVVVNPLVQQGCNLPAEVSGMVKSRQFKVLQ